MGRTETTGTAVQAPGRTRRTAAIVVAAGVALVLAVVAAAATKGLTTADSIVLGVVEGLTEFLPLSSTGHLMVTERLLGIGRSSVDKAAADAYAICIQAGAILAVLVLYRDGLRSMIRGAAGHDRAGRQLLAVLAAAFAPAAAVGLAFGGAIEEHLFGVGPVVAAWAIGGVAILVLAPRGGGGRGALEHLTIRQGLIIGGAQALALWPGVSRSLVTILAALAVGLALPAAVEFSFLLGLVTLGAATGYKALQDGTLIIDQFGLTAPLVGLVVAFASAVVAMRWMIGYLNRHDLRVFAGYRLAVATLVGGLLVMGVFN